MSRWFRHYAGMMRDEKLVSAAVKSKQPVERVVWVWGAILESASEINDNGRYEFDAGEAAYFLRCDDADLVCILACLESLGRLSGGVVVRWGDRQYSSDSAAERQRKYRERKSANATVHGDDRNGKRDSDVTVTSRDGGVTPQETDTELDTERKKAPPSPPGGGAGSFEELEKAYPVSNHTNPVKAERLYSRLTTEHQRIALSQAKAVASATAEDRMSRGRDVKAHAEFVKGLDTWLREGQWKSAPMPDTSDIAIVNPDSPDFEIIKAFLGERLVLSKSGNATVRLSDLEQARAAA